MFGFKLANKAADKEHPYGHARYEYITGIIISLLILSMGVIFTKSSIEKIFSPEEIVINVATYIVLIIAIIGKLIQMFVYLDFSKAIKSETIKATAIDARNDIITTSAVLLSVIIMGIFKINIDAYAGLIVSIFIVISGINTLKDTINPLLGVVATKEQVEEIKSKILSHKEIRGIHDLVIHNYGPQNNFATVHTEISADMDILIAHDLMDNIEKEVKEDLGIDLTIHMDPLELNDEKTSRIYQKTKGILKNFDDTLKMHDFRLVSGETHTNAIFDIMIPYEKNYSEKELINILKDGFKDEEIKYYFVITIDRPFY